MPAFVAVADQSTTLADSGERRRWPQAVPVSYRVSEVRGEADMTNPDDSPMRAPQLVRPGPASARLGVSHRTLLRWVEAGLIKVQYTAGGQVRVPASEIERIAAGGLGRKKGQHYELPDPGFVRARARGREIARQLSERLKAAGETGGSGLTGRQITEAQARGREIARSAKAQMLKRAKAQER